MPIKHKNIYPFIMAGGVGSRLWPISTPAMPKQFLPLVSNASLLQDTIARTNCLANQNPCTVICSKEHEKLAQKQIGELQNGNSKIILEFERYGTAFTVAVAALSALEQDKQAYILMLPSDHFIENVDAFQATIERAMKAHMDKHSFIVFGVEPQYPETGFGYIEMDRDHGVLSFTEKPDIEKARAYLASGNYLWNLGLFLFSATAVLEALESHAPEIYKAALQSWKHADRTSETLVTLQEVDLSDEKRISIDHAVLEKTDAISAYKLNTRWSDLGTWRSLWKYMRLHSNGNILSAVLKVINICFQSQVYAFRSRNIR